jgi:O-antigen/teichoic acid export membrane protein
LQTDLHNYFVSSRFGSVVFAVYSVGCFQLPLMNLIGEATAVVLIPQIALLQRRGETEQITALTLRALRKLALVAFPLFCFLMVVAPEFLTLLYTDRYRESVPIFRVNLLMIPMSVLLVDPILRAYAEYRYQLLGLRVLLFILQFSLLWLATSIYGPWSAILIVVGIAILERIGTAVFCGWIVGFSGRQAGHLIPALHIALAAGAAGLAVTGLKTLLPALPKVGVLLACGLLFGLLYAGLLLSFQIVTPQEVSLVTRWLPPRWRDRFMPS